MRKTMLILALGILTAVGFGQTRNRERNDEPYWRQPPAVAEYPNHTRDLGTIGENRRLRVPERGERFILRDETGEYRGRLNRSEYDSQSISNPNASYGRRWGRSTDVQRRRMRIYESEP